MSLGPIQLSPIISGYVADKYNWRTNFWILTAFTAVNLILVILFAPETQYERPPIYNTDIATTQSSPAESATNPAEEERGSPNSTNKALTARNEDPKQEKPRTYWQELKPYSGLRLKENPWKHLTQLLTCALYPAVIWTFLVGGTYSGWVSPPFLSLPSSPPLSLKTTPPLPLPSNHPSNSSAASASQSPRSSPPTPPPNSVT